MPHKIHKKSRLHENVFNPRAPQGLGGGAGRPVAPQPTDDSDEVPAKPTTQAANSAPAPATTAEGFGDVRTRIFPVDGDDTTSTPTPTTPAVVTRPAAVVTTVVTPVLPLSSSSSNIISLSSSASTLASLTAINSLIPSSSSSSLLVQTTPALTTPVAVASTPTRVPLASTSGSSVIVGFTPSSVPPVQPTSTEAASSGLGTGSIVGLAAAGLAGIAVLGAAGVWLFKKYNSHRDDEEPHFQRNSWMRNSVAIPDDVSTGGHTGGAAGIGAAAGFGAAAAASQGPNVRPRPPTMIERHQQNVAAMRTFTPGPAYPDPSTMPGYGAGGYGGYGASAGYGAAAGYDSYDGQAPMRSISPGHAYPGPSPASPQPYFNPIASPPPIGHSPAPSEVPGTPVYFQRHDSQNQPMVIQDHPYASNGSNEYANMERSSPYPTQTYQAKAENVFADPAAMPAAPAPVAIPAALSLARAAAAQGRSSPSPPLSPARTAQVVHVPDADMHAGRETPVQFGYSEPATPPPAVTAPEPAAAAASRAAKRSSVVSKKSVAGRPETMYDDEDAYAGI